VPKVKPTSEELVLSTSILVGADVVLAETVGEGWKNPVIADAEAGAAPVLAPPNLKVGACAEGVVSAEAPRKLNQPTGAEELQTGRVMLAGRW
jgi:hypothetical protein